MNKILSNRSLWAWLLLICAIVFVIADVSPAASPGRATQRPQRNARGRGSRAGQNTTASAAKQIEDALDPLLDHVNLGEKPSVEIMAEAGRCLKDNKRFLKTLKPEELSNYYLLNAWSGYFAGNMKTAQLSAAKAYRADPANTDAQITQVSLAILSGGKLPRARSSRQAKETKKNDKGLLDLDIKAVKTELIGEKIDPMKLNCINSTSLEYNPAENGLCILFWQLKETSESSYGTPAEPNDAAAVSRPKKKDTRSRTRSRPQTRGFGEMPGMSMGPMGMGPGGMGMGPGGMGMGGPMGPMGPGMMQGRQGPGYTMRSMISDLDPFSAQTVAFSRMFKDNMVAGDIKFVAVNTDSVSNRQAVVDKLIANPWPWAQVMAKSANSGFTGFADMKVDIKKPTLVIADKGGVIKYAGPAAGFLAPLVAEQISGNPSKPAAGIGNMLTEVRTTRPTPKATQPSRLVQDDIEKLMVDVQAGKLLENAKMLIRSGSKLGSPRRGVEMCRRIIKEYPNTTYADEARKLLRGLNQRFQDRYKVTDEEMGL